MLLLGLPKYKIQSKESIEDCVECLSSGTEAQSASQKPSRINKDVEFSFIASLHQVYRLDILVFSLQPTNVFFKDFA